MPVEPRKPTGREFLNEKIIKNPDLKSFVKSKKNEPKRKIDLIQGRFAVSPATKERLRRLEKRCGATQVSKLFSAVKQEHPEYSIDRVAREVAFRLEWLEFGQK